MERSQYNYYEIFEYMKSQYKTRENIVPYVLRKYPNDFIAIIDLKTRYIYEACGLKRNVGNIEIEYVNRSIRAVSLLDISISIWLYDLFWCGTRRLRF